MALFKTFESYVDFSGPGCERYQGPGSEIGSDISFVGKMHGVAIPPLFLTIYVDFLRSWLVEHESAIICYNSEYFRRYGLPKFGPRVGR